MCKVLLRNRYLTKMVTFCFGLLTFFSMVLCPHVTSAILVAGNSVREHESVLWRVSELFIINQLEWLL